MRKLYYPKFYFKVNLNYGDTICHTYNLDAYRYIDIDKIEKYVKCFENISEFVYEFSPCVMTDYNLFKKQKCFKFDYNQKYMYYNDIKNIEVRREYIELDSNITMKKLFNKLNYEEYLQLIFDKEHELKSVLLKENM